MKKDGDNFQPVGQRVSFSDVVVSSDDRDSLGETKLDGFTNYQGQTRKRHTNRQKLCYCFVGVILVVILLFFLLILIALWND
tara:strand:+ start:174 stop:419 length:246 start_codon:yes stop_codon:yes gene_type:complete